MKINTELERVKAVQRYLEFNQDREKDLKEITMLASVICKTPIALITLMDTDVQLVKAGVGIEVEEMPRSTSFCTHAIEIDEIMEVRDATLDIRFADAPVVTNDPHIRFYASANLKSYDGFNVGTLCVYDFEPKKLDEQQLECLSALANQVSHIMELDRSLKQLKNQNAILSEIARIESHEIRQPVASILGVMALIKEFGTENMEYMQLLELSVNQLDERIRTIVTHTNTYTE
ncbi:MAG TPA: GAF domain-containing protein [Sphingobacteriaceae bacterium]|nr:GAF domain-containing protein [Sphingobacteriaceae bacterium]